MTESTSTPHAIDPVALAEAFAAVNTTCELGTNHRTIEKEVKRKADWMALVTVVTATTKAPDQPVPLAETTPFEKLVHLVSEHLDSEGFYRIGIGKRTDSLQRIQKELARQHDLVVGVPHVKTAQRRIRETANYQPIDYVQRNRQRRAEKKQQKSA